MRVTDIQMILFVVEVFPYLQPVKQMITQDMCMLCYLGLLLVPSSQELHNYDVGLGHLQYTVHLLSIINWLLTTFKKGETLITNKSFNISLEQYSRKYHDAIKLRLLCF